MGWLIVIFIVYFLCLLVERALVNLSPHDLDFLRNEEGRAAREAARLSLEIRPSLAALLLARIFLVSLAGVIATTFVLHSPIIETLLLGVSSGSSISPALLWGVALGALAFGLSLAVWGLQKIDFQKSRSALFLKRLWWVGAFWKALFVAFIQKEKKQDSQTSNDKESASGSPEGRVAASEKRELELLKSIVQFGDVTVKQVMQPRSKVVSVEFKTDFQELLEVVRQSEFSRLPVYDEDQDNITGILYVKDLVPYLNQGASFEWQPLIRTNVLVVPEAKRGSELLEEFKKQRLHMAIVVDEYGGLAGIVTMEDILEEVTGDIRDEFDEESEIRYRKIDDFTYLFEGQTLLNDVCRISGLAPGTFDPVRGTSDTLAGLALELRGDIPLIGTEVAWNGFLLSVTLADKRRVEQIKLSLPRPER